MEDRFILLGIDPSFTTCGVCIYNTKDKSMKMKTGNMMDMIDWIQDNCDISKVIAVVENPDKDKTTFGMWGMVQAKIQAMNKYNKERFSKVVPKVTMADVKSAFLIAMNYAQKVGKNKSSAQQMIIMLKSAEIPVIEIAPSSRQKAFTKKDNKTVRRDVLKLKMPTKTTQDQFRNLTGYSGRTSEHARDAATMVWGRTMVWANHQILISSHREIKQPSAPSSTNDNFFILDSTKKK